MTRQATLLYRYLHCPGSMVLAGELDELEALEFSCAQWAKWMGDHRAVAWDVVADFHHDMKIVAPDRTYRDLALMGAGMMAGLLDLREATEEEALAVTAAGNWCEGCAFWETCPTRLASASA
jgi:hypothetical protein